MGVRLQIIEILIGFSMINHPAIGVPRYPINWKPPCDDSLHSLDSLIVVAAVRSQDYILRLNGRQARPGWGIWVGLTVGS